MTEDKPSHQQSHDRELRPFKAFSLLRFILGASIYSYKAFYDVKNLLVRYDGSTDYVNYGYWSEGQDTINPSGKLVELVASRLGLTAGDVLLNVGSGLGQPDVDIVNTFSVERIIGINISPEQVTYANDKFRSLGLDDRIEHRLLDTRDISELLAHDGITCVIILEVIAAIPDSDKLLKDCFGILPHGGRVSFCDSVTTPDRTVGIFKRFVSRILLSISTVIYGDDWQSIDEYEGKLKRAGFGKIRHQKIGENVFPSVFQFARKRFPLLKTKKIPFIPRIGAYLNLRSLDLLFSWGQIDYTIFTAEKLDRD